LSRVVPAKRGCIMKDICGLVSKVVDVMPMPVLVVDGDAKILYTNPSARGLFPREEEKIRDTGFGEALVCANSLEKGCGNGEFCDECVIRDSVGKAVQGKQLVRKKTKLKIMRGGKLRHINLYITAAPVSHEDRDLVMIMLEDVNELIQLTGILPICAGCKKIRDDKDVWVPLEKYISGHVDVDFSHSFCPDCIKKLYPDIAKELEEKK
jgi:hypothetical protein